MKQNKFSKYAWFVLVYNVGVVVWGAYVRATGSGAGCGSHWPTCNGQVIPRGAALETIIEFSHRTTSALAGILVLLLLIWAFIAYPKKHIVRKGAAASFILIITEGLVGAGLVLFELVAHNASTARAFAVATHLLNTFFLLAALTLTAWWAGGGKPLRLKEGGNRVWVLGIALFGVILLGMTGAITALGDTLFPAGSLSEGIAADFEATAHFLVRLRVWHPIIAVAMGLYILVVAGYFSGGKESAQTKKLAQALFIAFICQLMVGGINLMLLAPVPLQLLHLLMADTVWITLVLLSASALAERERTQNIEQVSQDITQ